MPIPIESTPSISHVCLLLAAVSGFIKTLESVVVAFPPQHAKRHNYTVSRGVTIISVIANLILTIGEVVAKIIAVGLGPVAIVVPVLISTNLMSNMMLQPLLGMATYSQNTIIGTLVLVAAATMLIDVGPSDLSPEDSVLDTVTSISALSFLGSMVVAVFASLSALACGLATRNLSKVFMYASLEQSAVVVCTAATKIAQSDIPRNVRLSMVALYLCCSVIPTVTGARANAELDDPSLYIPIGAGTNLLLTALAGLFLWGDGRRLSLPLSYTMIYIIVVLSCYLVSKDDILGITKQSVAEAHINKFKHAVRKIRRNRVAASGLGHYGDHDFHHKAPRGKSARALTLPSVLNRPMTADSSELTGKSDDRNEAA